jgi:nucleotide-binding universal stress UspA family protein
MVDRDRHLHVVVGADGSADSRGALVNCVRLFGPIIGKLTIAVVLDYDGDLSNVPDHEQQRARAILDEDASIATAAFGAEPEKLTLLGRPADTLVQFARDNGCDLIVVGPRGHGAYHLILGSVASHLARGVGVPVAILPPV